MTRSRSLIVVLLALAAFLFLGADAKKPAAPDWAMNATIIEACSCPMFCQCYFNGEPAVHAGHTGLHAGHAEGHYCRFNNAYKVNKGYYGAKIWISGDLGADFSKGETEWAVLTFDPSVTKEQRDAIATVVGKVYPVKWRSFAIAKDSPVEWNATKDMAHASLDGGKTAEVGLGRFPGMTSDPVVIKNLRYFGAPRNDGFIMMPNTVEAYRVGDKAFEYKGTNGFMITFDINSKDGMSPKVAM